MSKKYIEFNSDGSINRVSSLEDDLQDWFEHEVCDCYEDLYGAEEGEEQ